MFTNFIFEIFTREQKELDLIYDIFTQMFVDPIISADNIAKEVNAIDSEYNMHFNEHEFMWDVLGLHVANNHPVGNFECGNKKTLFEQIEDKKFLQELILLFRSQYYNARDAALVITSPIELDKMQPMIVAKFTSLPNFDGIKH